MPYGLTNAPATFQRYMDCSLLGQPRTVHPAASARTKAGPLLYTCTQVFMDDVIIYAPTWEQHLLDLEATLQAFITNGVPARLDKCIFGQLKIKYIGYVLSREPDRHLAQPREDQGHHGLGPATNLDTLRSALGTFGHYRKRIPNFSTGHRAPDPPDQAAGPARIGSRESQAT